MRELSIKLKIADREYPMKIDPADEARIRDAGRRINESIKTYREKFGIDDKQDLLAMVAFDSVVDYLKGQEESSQRVESILQKVSSLNHLISEAIS